MSATLDSRTIENLPRRHSRTIENQRAPATIFFIVSGIQKVSGEALPVRSIGWMGIKPKSFVSWAGEDIGEVFSDREED